MFPEVNYDSLKNEVQSLKNTDKLLEESVYFLNSKLDEYTQSDNILEDYEIDIIEKQIEYHKELAELNKEYNDKRNIIRDSVKEYLSQQINNLSNSHISDTHLLEIDGILEQRLFMQGRKNIDSAVNNTSGLEGIYDGVMNGEKTRNFINVFTLTLLNRGVNIEKGVNDLTSDDITLFLHETIGDLLDKGLSFPDKIEIANMFNGTISYDLLKIKNTILDEHEKIKKAEEEKRIQEQKEKDKIYLVDLLVQELSGALSGKGKEVLKRKFNYEGNIDDGNNKGHIHLLNTYIEKGYIDKNFILNLYDEGKIKKILLLNFLEQEEGFNYALFIERYGLTEGLVKVSLEYSRKELGITEKELSNEKIIENLTLFFLTFTMIESSGFNIRNRSGESSADGYFQYLNANGKKVNGKWATGSFQTALQRIKKVLPEHQFELRFKDFDSIGNPNMEKKKKPSELSAENQSIKFFLDISENRKNLGQGKNEEIFSQDMMRLIISDRNSWALGRIYKLLHHTDPDKTTVAVYEREKNYYYFGKDR